MNVRDLLERVFWTAVSGGLLALTEVQFDLGSTWTPLVLAAWTGVLVILRKKLPVFPDPGDGLPGLPT